MRILLLILTIIPQFIFSQDSTVSLSKFELFSSDAGKMYKYETVDVGKLRGWRVSVARVTNVETGHYTDAIRVAHMIRGLLAPVDVNIITIDMDEADGVIRSLDYYQAEISKGKPQHTPLFVYITSNDVVVSCNYSDVGLSTGWYVNLSRRYKFLKSMVAGSEFSVWNKDIDDLVELMKKARQTKL